MHGGVPVQTDIDSDNDLEGPSQDSSVSRKKEPADPALQEPVTDLRELKGTGGIRPDYEYKKLRHGA